MTPGSKGGFGEAFSKWFGNYKRSLGIDNKNSVFHSFRHGFKDVLRAAGVNEDDRRTVKMTHVLCIFVVAERKYLAQR
jgi:hypothetical protein